MKKNITSTLRMLAMASVLLFAACNKDKKEELQKGKPVVTSSRNAIFLSPFSSDTLSLTISAAAKIKDLTATATVGTVEVTELTGKGQTTGKAVLKYTAGANQGTDQIKIMVSDELGQVTEVEISVSIQNNPPIELQKGNVSGTWAAGNTYIVRGDLVVPQGQSLVIEQGVTVIVDGDGTQGSPEIVVKGNIASMGTAENPVTFTVVESKRTEANIFTGLWGGIICVESCQEAVFVYTNIEYAGAVAGPESESVKIGELKDGDYRYAIYFENTQGKLVVRNSRISFTPDDGIVLNGGQIQIVNNFFEYNGRVGGESININSGVIGDVAFNVFFRPATNGVKWDNKGNKEPQTDCRIFNNTIIEGGWRQTKSGRGGSLNVQRDGRGMVYNNLIVNCRFGVRLREDQLPDTANVMVGYQWYYGDNATIAGQFYPTNGVLMPGQKETSFDVAGLAGANNPQFVNFIVTNFDMEKAKDPAMVKFRGNIDLRLSPSSPALIGGKTTFLPKISSISAMGHNFNTPAPAAYRGALSSN